MNAMEGILTKTEQMLHTYLQNLGLSPVIKLLDKNLCQMGDLLVQSKIDSEMRLDEQALLTASKDFPLPFGAISIVNNVAHIWLDRVAAFRATLTQKEWECTTRATNDGSSIYVEEPTSNEWATMSLTEFRADMLRTIVKNCFIHAGYTVVQKAGPPEEDHNHDGNTMQVKIVHQKSKVLSQQCIEVLCGNVLTGSETQNAAQYISMRANDMQLIAQHRYGLRLPDVNKMQTLVSSLGRSAAMVDMLHTSHTNVIDMRNQQGILRNQCSSKGASFIMYNYARMASILKKHTELVENGELGVIPPVHEIDFALLTDPDEWLLLYAYLMRFPNVVQQTIGYGELVGRIAPYHLLNFTLCMIKCLSKYYRRVRILTENRPKLQPVMLARLYLIRAVFNMLRVILKILDLEPIEEM
uniref:DALR anticodon binding domain-containing protein n=1 Tax=Anopheles christyi TaxID=43041 RepID=A0A182JS60_9DIPT